MRSRLKALWCPVLAIASLILCADAAVADSFPNAIIGAWGGLSASVEEDGKLYTVQDDMNTALQSCAAYKRNSKNVSLGTTGVLLVFQGSKKFSYGGYMDYVDTNISATQLPPDTFTTAHGYTDQILKWRMTDRHYDDGEGEKKVGYKNVSYQAALAGMILTLKESGVTSRFYRCGVNPDPEATRQNTAARRENANRISSVGRPGSFPLSAKGVQATLRNITGIDTDHAFAIGQITPADHIEYCERDPGGIATQQGGVQRCARISQANTRQAEFESFADCVSKEITLWDGKWRIAKYDGIAFTWITPKRTVEKSWNGTAVAEAQFELLCPTSFDRIKGTAIDGGFNPTAGANRLKPYPAACPKDFLTAWERFISGSPENMKPENMPTPNQPCTMRGHTGNYICAEDGCAKHREGYEDD